MLHLMTAFLGFFMFKTSQGLARSVVCIPSHNLLLRIHFMVQAVQRLVVVNIHGHLSKTTFRASVARCPADTRHPNAAKHKFSTDNERHRIQMHQTQAHGPIHHGCR